MILLVIVVQSEDVDKLSNQLVNDGFRLTRFQAKGGFLAAGSAILLVGAEEEQMPAITGVIQATCSTRMQVVNAWPTPATGGTAAIGVVAPVEVSVGGAIVFCIPVQQFVRLGGPQWPPIKAIVGDDTHMEERNPASQWAATERVTDMITDRAATDQAAEAGSPLQAGSPDTKLVVAIVQRENTDMVVSALRDAGFRLTRIDTAGGFLRRGNATLLIGVEAARLNDVLGLIHMNCRPRTEPAPLEDGMPMYGATVFVLEASDFMRF